MEYFLNLLVLVSVLGVIYPWRLNFPQIHRARTANVEPKSKTCPLKSNLTTEDSSAENYCLTKECIKVASITLSFMDDTVDPCQNFYKYACGNFQRTVHLQDKGSSYTTGTLHEQAYDIQKVLKIILEDKNYKTESEAEKKVRIFYDSCLNKQHIDEEEAFQPLLNVLKDMGGWNISGNFNVESWTLQNALEIMANQYNIPGLFQWTITSASENDSTNILQLHDIRSRMLFVDQFIERNEKFALDYLEFMTHTGVILGGDKSTAYPQMEDLLNFQDELKEVEDTDNTTMMTLSNLSSTYPLLDWVKFFNAAFQRVDIPITEDQEIVVHSPAYFNNIFTMIKDMLQFSEGKQILANYMGWTLISSMLEYMPESTYNKYLRLKETTGEVLRMSHRNRCVRTALNGMQEVLAAMFIRHEHLEDRKKQVKGFVGHMKQAFKESIDRVSWLNDTTKKTAKAKVDSLTINIGYTDDILNPSKLDSKYKNLHFKKNEFLRNVLKMRAFVFKKGLHQLGLNESQDIFENNILTVDDFYKCRTNELGLPLAIILPPQFDTKYPASVNRGSLGVIIAHEIIHGFDADSVNYHKDKQYPKWWNDEDEQKYSETVACLSDLYSSYPAKNGSKIVKPSTNENIADSIALTVAFESLKNWTKKFPNIRLLPALNLTHDQLFFTRFAQTFCSLESPANATNESHQEFRIHGTVSNSKGFAKAFNCKKDSPMNPSKKCVEF